MQKGTYETREKFAHLYLVNFEWLMVAERVGFVPRATSETRVARSLNTASTPRPSESEGLAERVGFEPTCRLPDKTLSRRPRYDHFGTSPGRMSRVEHDIITFRISPRRRLRRLPDGASLEKTAG